MRAHPAGPRYSEVLPAAHHSESFPTTSELHELDSQIWSSTVTRNTDGELVIGGVSATELVDTYGSPLFVLDEVDVRQRCRAFRDAFADAEIPGTVYYAGKAFLAGKLLQWIQDEGLSLDVATGGELELALRAGFPAERIGLHGNNKSVAELTRAVQAGVGHIVLDSLPEIDRLAQVVRELGADPAPVLLRVTVGVEAHTHEFIATAHEDQKFGLSLAAGAAREAMERLLATPELDFHGLHSHIGSQIFDTAGFEVAAARVVQFASEIVHDLGATMPVLNLGGGMGIAYVGGDDPVSPAHMAQSLRDIIRRECTQHNLPLPQLMVEPGRAIIGPSMLTLYRVGTVKDVVLGAQEQRRYLSVDGGMSDNIRTALYDAVYTSTPANRQCVGEPIRSRVVGKHCESGDIVIDDTWLPADLADGDLLAVAATGAYCRAMASNYNLLLRPAVVSVRDGRSEVVIRREELSDMFALDALLGSATTTQD